MNDYLVEAAGIEQGLAEAQFYIGFMYLHGDGVSKDKSSAERWLKKAAAQGHAEAKKALEDL